MERTCRPNDFRNIIAVEVKGGTDFSNIHNRIGEAEKSHQTPVLSGFNPNPGPAAICTSHRSFHIAFAKPSLHKALECAELRPQGVAATNPHELG